MSADHTTRLHFVILTLARDLGEGGCEVFLMSARAEEKNSPFLLNVEQSDVVAVPKQQSPRTPVENHVARRRLHFLHNLIFKIFDDNLREGGRGVCKSQMDRKVRLLPAAFHLMSFIENRKTIPSDPDSGNTRRPARFHGYTRSRLKTTTLGNGTLPST